jgi:Na+/H+ antiporter NhaD/arsenite permease-like protein
MNLAATVNCLNLRTLILTNEIKGWHFLIRNTLLQGIDADQILKAGFGHFSDIAVLFTAVAIPAHMIERSGAFEFIAASVGWRLGRRKLRNPGLADALLVNLSLLMTTLLAGVLHNITAILLMIPIIISLCRAYGVPSRWILSGALAASNLGGFSTKWGDTPNIIESKIWNLKIADFFIEIVPANMIVLGMLIVVVLVLTRRSTQKQDDGSIAVESGRYWQKCYELVVDWRLLLTGFGGLFFFIVSQGLWPKYQIVIGIMTILFSLLGERSTDRLTSLKALGFDCYIVFASVFVLAGCIEHSWIGHYLQQLIVHAGASKWAIVLTGYFGTSFTEAASWATVAAGQIYPLDQSHSAAWALGGGICAGSSSIVTAASAGIILCQETTRVGDSDDHITFGRYLPFGIGFSLVMLAFYSVYFSLIQF